MDYTTCALENDLISSKGDIGKFRYGPYVGHNAVRVWLEHRLRERFPHILPVHTESDFADVIGQFTRHEFDGERVEDIVNARARSLGERKQLYDRIMAIADSKHILDASGNNTLPSFTEKTVATPTCELVSISLKLPQGAPIRRADVQSAISPGHDVDEIISGLVCYRLI